MSVATRKIEFTEEQIFLIKSEITESLEVGKKCLIDATEQKKAPHMLSLMHVTNEFRKILLALEV